MIKKFAQPLSLLASDGNGGSSDKMGVEYPAKKLTMGYCALHGLDAPCRMVAAFSGLHPPASSAVCEDPGGALQ